MESIRFSIVVYEFYKTVDLEKEKKYKIKKNLSPISFK